MPKVGGSLPAFRASLTFQLSRKALHFHHWAKFLGVRLLVASDTRRNNMLRIPFRKLWPCSNRALAPHLRRKCFEPSARWLRGQERGHTQIALLTIKRPRALATGYVLSICFVPRAAGTALLSRRNLSHSASRVILR
jgi:hypothetical protein